MKYVCPVCREDVTAQVERKNPTGKHAVIGICQQGHYATYPPSKGAA